MMHPGQFDQPTLKSNIFLCWSYAEGLPNTKNGVVIVLFWGMMYVRCVHDANNRIQSDFLSRSTDAATTIAKTLGGLM